MKSSRYSTSRQKSCKSCTFAKVKCDRALDKCARCQRRNIACEYPQTTNTETPGIKQQSSDSQVRSTSRKRPEQLLLTKKPTSPTSFLQVDDFEDSLPAKSFRVQRENIMIDLDGDHVRSDSIEMGDLNFLDLDLSCPINVDEITNCRMKQILPGSNEIEKPYSNVAITFLWRMLKSYVDCAIRGRYDIPFVHSIQMTQVRTMTPLVRCLNLIRICQSDLPGSKSIAATIFRNEMKSVLDEWSKYDAISLLAAFQAYLIYTLTLFFHLEQTNSETIKPAMNNLQNLARTCCQQGIVASAEQHQIRPRWEEWLITEIKMRSMYVMYLFDTIVSVQQNLPTFLALELRGLPAPCPKSLWQARTRVDWIQNFNVHLVDWPKYYLRIEELRPASSDMDDSTIVKRRTRLDRWLEDVDEFGTMLYAVVCYTHGV